MTTETQSQDELQVVGYTVEADGVRYTSNTEEGATYWKGQAEGVIEPVVRKSEADAKISELSDMVVSLAETQSQPVTFEDVREFLETHQAGFMDGSVEPVTFDDVPGHDVVVTTVLKRLQEGGIAKFPVKPDLILFPEGLDQNTKELVMTFTLALAAKLLVAKDKYGYTDGWRQGYSQEDCLKHFQEHIEKGDPRDVAAFAMFMWYHGWSTNGTPAPAAQ